jgi:endonuclease III
MVEIQMMDSETGTKALLRVDGIGPKTAEAVVISAFLTMGFHECERCGDWHFGRSAAWHAQQPSCEGESHDDLGR